MIVFFCVWTFLTHLVRITYYGWNLSFDLKLGLTTYVLIKITIYDLPTNNHYQLMVLLICFIYHSCSSFLCTGFFIFNDIVDMLYFSVYQFPTLVIVFCVDLLLIVYFNYSMQRDYTPVSNLRLYQLWSDCL